MKLWGGIHQVENDDIRACFRKTLCKCKAASSGATSDYGRAAFERKLKSWSAEELRSGRISCTLSSMMVSFEKLTVRMVQNYYENDWLTRDTELHSQEVYGSSPLF